MNIEDLPVLDTVGSKVGPFEIVDRAELLLISRERRIAYVVGKSKPEDEVLFLTDHVRVKEREREDEKIILYVNDGEYYMINSAEVTRYSSLKTGEL